MCFDLRYLLLLLINFLKDSNPIFTKTTNRSLTLVFLILFCTTSVKLSLGLPSESTTLVIRFEPFQKFSYQMAVSLISSLLFPKEYFWIAYPIILFCSFCSLPARLLSRLARLFSSILLVVYLDMNPTVMIHHQENLEAQRHAEDVVVLDIYDHEEE